MKSQRLGVLIVAGVAAFTLTACGSSTTSSDLDTVRPSAPLSPSQQGSASDDPSITEGGANDPVTDDDGNLIMKNVPLEEVADAYAARYDAFVSGAVSTGRAIKATVDITDKGTGESIVSTMILNPDGSSTTVGSGGPEGISYQHDCPQADTCYLSTDGGQTWTLDPRQSELNEKALDTYDTGLIMETLPPDDTYAFRNGDDIFEIQGPVDGQYTRFTFEFIDDDRLLTTMAMGGGSIVTDMTYTDPVLVSEH